MSEKKIEELIELLFVLAITKALGKRTRKNRVKHVKPYGEYKFKPGYSGNPIGRPRA